MRRAVVMMKPYFTLFRNNYPKSNNYFYWAHWWHPVIYEAMIIAGNGDAEATVTETGRTSQQVLQNRPLRMLLSREMMPRYARLSTESANIFDNLHMLHGIAYDILAYEGWTIEQKRDEMYRVIRAMPHQPGDQALARKFSLPHPEMDPRIYEPWMQGANGEMTRIMREMLDEMMPMMMPGGMSAEDACARDAAVREQDDARHAAGRAPGLLADALKAEMGQMTMAPEASAPGATPQMMVATVLAGWRKKYGDMPDLPPISMETEPTSLSAPGEGGLVALTE
jgi:hypothetical protein